MKYLAIATIVLVVIFTGCYDTSSDNNATNNPHIQDDNISSDATNESESNTTKVSMYTPPKQIFTSTTADTVLHPGAYVTSQCYTKTEDNHGGVYNPCFSCHINSEEPNYINDPDLQVSYAFSEKTKVNPFTNLFKDRSDQVEAIHDSTILGYIRSDNYFDSNNTIILAETLKNVPDEWDYNQDGNWSGYTPDCYFNFDDEGFDKDFAGEYTGWRAFAYYPFLGTFWPTNGSTDDVLIRLPEIMQQNINGEFDIDTYKLNLAIVESLIKKTDIYIEAVDESKYGVDLNQNGTLDTANFVVFNWEKPKYDLTERKIYDFSMYYVGKAKEAQISNELLLAPGLYPKGTEFLHTVRYIDIDENGNISMAKRMKELRYGVKKHWNNYGQLQNLALSEAKEKEAFPDRLRTLLGNSETGIGNGMGWVYQGFIEDKHGYLRPQTREESYYCIGCHSGIGAVEDSTFVFPRKLDHNAKQMGWYHWTQKNNAFKDMKEPVLADGRHEYTLYLEKNRAGDEFRDNKEVMEKFFDEQGKVKEQEIVKLHNDISHLIVPSVERALMLNKAYKVIVDEQSYIYGRDAHVKPVTNVHKEVEIDQATGNEPVMMDRYPLQ